VQNLIWIRGKYLVFFKVQNFVLFRVQNLVLLPYADVSTGLYIFRYV